ncbi:ABC transporter ATP-binding protein [Geminocystis sp. NIES-3708]|uniref:ABC transporter ATP-binding protein n=1 Tax=Geminocystis sp. NIES-3708 TaxID=1615909 RepID=UPI0005FC5DD8|nr:ATP-binding cassette domain-containing protein [Geminocystis sp. NIES-3708]BAQ60589.1 ABC transporter ATP-binding protein [Geminocystis sp. NIES-3708]
MNLSEPIIELKEVSKSFGNKIILDKANLKIYEGDALVIIGPSGTGKSTILRIIAGLTEPDEGEIYIKGKKRVGFIEDHQDSMIISMVFQQAALFDSLSVRENIGFSLYQHSGLSHDKIKDIVNNALDMVGLPLETANLFPAELSGGMRKRVSFARAMIFNPNKPEERPEVILYDEPTAGLDPIASTMVEDLVRHLQITCNAYLMVTHQNSTIRRTGDRLVFLYDGQFQWDGHIQEIDTTDNPLVRQFFSASIEGPIK